MGPSHDESRVDVSLVAALDLAGVIGVDNRLPWHLPRDLAHFKKLTLGKPVIMGRRTFESIGRPLPGRANIVLTHGASAFVPPAGCETARTLEQALALARARGSGEAMVIGGAGVFAAALPRADRLYMTVVEARVVGDTHFPPVAAVDWRVVALERTPADERNQYACAFVTLERAVATRAGSPASPDAHGAIDWAALVEDRHAAPRAV